MNFAFNNQELKNKRIIIIEDDVPSVKYYETILTNSGADIKVFTNGKDFLTFLEKSDEKIDLLMVDFLVPLVNGIECVRIFRKERKDVPVLMLTAYYSDQSKNGAFVAGCNEYILKPVFPEKIYHLLVKYLKTEISISSVI